MTKVGGHSVVFPEEQRVHRCQGNLSTWRPGNSIDMVAIHPARDALEYQVRSDGGILYLFIGSHITS